VAPRDLEAAPATGGRAAAVLRPRAVAWSRTGRYLAQASRRPRAVRGSDAATGAERAHLTVRHSVYTLAFGPGHREVVLGGKVLFARWPWLTGRPVVALRLANRHLAPRVVRLVAGGRRLLLQGFYHREVSVWDLATGKLQAELWPVQGGHWVATSAAGAVDATAVGRQTLVTLVPPISAAPRGLRRPEAVYGWELGWACFVRPGLMATAVAGRSTSPPRRSGCAITP